MFLAHVALISQARNRTQIHNKTNSKDKQWVPLSTSVRADNADTTVHIETEVQAAEEPGQCGGILEVHVAHLHDRRRQRHHLRRKRKGNKRWNLEMSAANCDVQLHQLHYLWEGEDDAVVSGSFDELHLRFATLHTTRRRRSCLCLLGTSACW